MWPADDNAREAGEALLAFRPELALALVTREFERHPELEARYGALGREKSLQDAGYHLAFLAQAVVAQRPALFADYAAWLKVMLAQRGVRPADLLFHLQCLREVLVERLPADRLEAILPVLDPVLAALPGMPDQVATFIEPDSPHAILAHQYLAALQRGERHHASQLILQAVDAGLSVQDLYLDVFQRSQHEVGRLWQSNQVNVAEEHYCTAATQLIMAQLAPRGIPEAPAGGTLVATCVSGDLHELGIRMVTDFFERAGWKTYYLGASTPATSVVQAVVAQRANVLAISATIAYHVRHVEDLIRLVRAAPGCAQVKILVGGAPFNQMPGLWQSIGADGHSADASGVVELAERLIHAHAA